MKRPLYDYSNRELLFRIFLKFGLKTHSEDHRSILLNKSKGTPLLISGLPRSGTTTILKQFALILGYSALFEPLVFNHLKVPNFGQISTCFRGNPSENELLIQDMLGGYFSNLDSILDDRLKAKVKSLLDYLCSQIVNKCGSAVVVKELRWIANLSEMHSLFTINNVEPRHLLIDPDPFMILYTHYRLGGLSELNDFNNLAVNEMYQRKIRTIREKESFSQLMSYPASNKWEKLLVSVIIDRLIMKDFSEKYPSVSHFASFHEIMSDQETIMSKLGYEHLDKAMVSKKLIVHEKRYLSDAYFKKRALKKVPSELFELLEKHTNATDLIWTRSTSCSTRKFFTHLAVKTTGA